MASPQPGRNIDWLGIGNLILTAIIGIGLALYINNQNAQLQLDVVKLQAKLAVQGSLAQIKASCSSDCSTFTIENSGPAIASNLRVKISLNTLQSQSFLQNTWSSVFNDIRKFEVIETPPALDFNKTTESNTITLSLANLAPNDTFDVALQPSQSNIGKIHSFNTDSVVAIYDQEKIETPFYSANDSNSVQNIINTYIFSKFRVASFDISVACTNCQGNTIYTCNGCLAYSAPFNASGSTTSPYIGLPVIASILHPYPDAPYVSFHVGSTVQKFQWGYELTNTTLQAFYTLPDTLKSQSIPDKLYLQVEHLPLIFAVVECQLPNCTNFLTNPA